ncbi:hypothetical protein Leryth_023537 [Lithospermum erythrorhizon]|nr:hypothetical protein Leryth_023537 [Lithospermum erythrorhizon]
MDFITIMLGLVLAFALLKILFSIGTKTKNLPPGPSSLPIIGNLHLIGDKPHETFANLATKYGPILTLKLGQITTIIVSSPNIAKEILQKQDANFAGKKVPDALHAHNHFKYSVVWLPANAQWRSLRKILTTHIFSNNRIELNNHLRLEKVKEMVEYCRQCSKSGEAVEIGQVAFVTTMNMLANTIFSKDLTNIYSNSAEAKEFKESVEEMMADSAKPNSSDYFPILGKFDPQGIRKRYARNFGKVLGIIDGVINERMEERKLRGVNSNNDVLDVFLNFIEENKDEIDRNHIKHSCLDLFIAGTDTTSSATEWAMAELLKNPEILKRAKDEIAEVIGVGKTIEEADIAQLPYLRSIVKETLRLHPPGPFLFPRKPDKDVEVSGYTILANSQVIVNIWKLGRDPSFWKDPLTFKPERFLDSDFDVRGHNFELLPFGSGRRVCPGIPLALKMFPTMLGSLINSFDWKIGSNIAPGELNMEERFGLALPMAHRLHAVPVPL